MPKCALCKVHTKCVQGNMCGVLKVCVVCQKIQGIFCVKLKPQVCQYLLRCTLMLKVDINLMCKNQKNQQGAFHVLMPKALQCRVSFMLE